MHFLFVCLSQGIILFAPVVLIIINYEVKDLTW